MAADSFAVEDIVGDWQDFSSALKLGKIKVKIPALVAKDATKDRAPSVASLRDKSGNLANIGLLMRLSSEPTPYSILNDGKESLHVCEGRFRIVVVVHQPVMVVVTLRENFINCEASLLHNRASMREVVGNFYCRLLERAVQTVSFLRRRTFPVVGTIPLVWRIEDFTRPLHGPEDQLS